MNVLTSTYLSGWVRRNGCLLGGKDLDSYALLLNMTSWDNYRVLRSDTDEVLFKFGTRHQAVRKALAVLDTQGIETYIIDTKGYVVKNIQSRILEKEVNHVLCPLQEVSDWSRPRTRQ